MEESVTEQSKEPVKRTRGRPKGGLGKKKLQTEINQAKEHSD